MCTFKNNVCALCPRGSHNRSFMCAIESFYYQYINGQLDNLKSFFISFKPLNVHPIHLSKSMRSESSGLGNYKFKFQNNYKMAKMPLTSTSVCQKCITILSKFFLVKIKARREFLRQQFFRDVCLTYFVVNNMLCCPYRLFINLN